MIEIAGGILLAVLVLFLLPIIIPLLAIGVAAAIALGIVFAVVMTIGYGNDQAHGVLLAIAVGVGFWLLSVLFSGRRRSPVDDSPRPKKNLHNEDGKFRHYVDDPIIPPMPDRNSYEWTDWRDKKGKWANR